MLKPARVLVCAASRTRASTLGRSCSRSSTCTRSTSSTATSSPRTSSSTRADTSRCLFAPPPPHPALCFQPLQLLCSSSASMSSAGAVPHYAQRMRSPRTALTLALALPTLPERRTLIALFCSLRARAHIDIHIQVEISAHERFTRRTPLHFTRRALAIRLQRRLERDIRYLSVDCFEKHSTFRPLAALHCTALANCALGIGVGIGIGIGWCGAEQTLKANITVVKCP